MFICMLYYYLDNILSGVTNYVHLGGTDAGHENTWLWTDGSPGINCLIVSI